MTAGSLKLIGETSRGILGENKPVRPKSDEPKYAVSSITSSIARLVAKAFSGSRLIPAKSARSTSLKLMPYSASTVSTGRLYGAPVSSILGVFRPGVAVIWALPARSI